MAIYLDYNATCPMDPEVIEAIQRSCIEDWGNPSSSYQTGRKAKSALDKARQSVAKMIGSNDPSQITFVSGGTEANHLAMHSSIEHFKKANPTVKPHVITSNIEHVATDLPLRKWLAQGVIELTLVEVCRKKGSLNVEDVMAEIKSNTCLITIMLANNETGIIQPIKEIGDRLQVINGDRQTQGQNQIPFHTDAAQAIGKIPVDVDILNVDYLTIVGHKFYGPRIGALYHRQGTGTIYPLFLGGGQEQGLRAGTENTPMIMGLGKAADLVVAGLDKDMDHLRLRRDHLIAVLQKSCLTLSDNFAHVENRLPNTLSASFGGCIGHDILTKCQGQIEASTTAACHSHGIASGSPVLLKSGLDPEAALGTIRLSVGRHTTQEEIEKAAMALKDVVNKDHQ
ncbi:selenocysteine lyase-like [Tigriopus californicus]|nr:selenocysteine lyase-like [Tigriopus californicus]XP_059084699.1 selenocysteine lyase-like [Tigriopus californicus]